MAHPMSMPWLDWKSIDTFPRDGEAYLANSEEVENGFPQVVYWDEDDCMLHVPDAGIAYGLGFFTHWAAIPSRT